MRDLDQQRAAFAWKRVDAARKELNDKTYEGYKNLAKAAPALIMNNGLMQTLAFFTSKGQKERNLHHRRLRDDILVWLNSKHCHIPVPKEYERAMDWMHSQASSEQYRLATGETMHLLRWLRQFADS